MEGEEEEVLVHDEPGDTFEVDTVRKDRSKDNKFKALLLSKSLPDWVVKAWQSTLSMTTGKQAKQRELVNKILERSSDGRLVINTENPQLQTMKDMLFLLRYGFS